MRVSDYVGEFLYSQDVRYVFEVVGGMITYLVDSIYRQGRVRLVSVHHEQAAAFAGEGLARMTGIPGVALATSGPGATNLLTGIGSCYFDAVPALFITGQVNRNEQRGERAIRQLGFQETDIVAMAEAITKAAWRVTGPEQVPDLLAKAYRLALSGRPGPVLLDIPMDVQRSEIDVPPPGRMPVSDPDQPDPEAIQALLAALARSHRPLILAGNGLRSAQVVDRFREFAEKLGVPVINSLLAVDVLPHDHPLRAGMIGTYGNRWANLAMGRADLLLVLGSRLDIRQTGADVRAFQAGKAIYHVDCEPGEINNRLTGCHAQVADLRAWLPAALEASVRFAAPDWSGWHSEIAALRRAYPDTAELRGVPGINPNQFMHDLSAASGQAAAYVVDVGQHQMWAGQSLDLHAGQRFLTSGGMGSLGFALPAAMGAALAEDGRPVLVIAGDGGFQFNIQELQTVAAHRLPVKIIIINNHCYGMVRQFQESYFESRYQSTYWGYSAPDFVRVAEAYGVPGARVETVDAVAGGLQALWADPRSPFLLEVMVDTCANAYPKTAFGRPITEMEPDHRPIEDPGL